MMGWFDCCRGVARQGCLAPSPAGCLKQLQALQMANGSRLIRCRQAAIVLCDRVCTSGQQRLDHTPRCPKQLPCEALSGRVGSLH